MVRMAVLQPLGRQYGYITVVFESVSHSILEKRRL